MKWGEDALQSGLQMLFKCRQVKETLKTHLRCFSGGNMSSEPRFQSLGLLVNKVYNQFDKTNFLTFKIQKYL